MLSPTEWKSGTGGFKVPTAPWRDMNYSHTSFSHTPHPSATTNSAENYKHHQLCLSLPLQKARDALSITDAKSPQHAVLMWRLPAWRQARGRDASESHYLPPPAPTPHTLKDTHSHSFPLLLLSIIISTYSRWSIHTHIRADESYLSFALCFSPKCRLRLGCCRSGLSSESKVRGSTIHPSSPPPSAQRGTLIYFMEYYFLSLS